MDQYDNYTVVRPDGQKQGGNGRLALGENIADSGGMEISFAAWSARNRATPDQKLPGLEKFTNEQLFFLFKAPFFCGQSRLEVCSPHS